MRFNHENFKMISKNGALTALVPRSVRTLKTWAGDFWLHIDRTSVLNNVYIEVYR